MSEHSQSYLDQLKFDPKLRDSFHAKFLKNIRLVFLLILLILAIGISSYIRLPRRLNPEIQIPIITIVTILPGAGPEDIETLVTEPIENALTGISNVDTISSVSSENTSVTTLEFLSTAEPDKALSDVQTAVNGVSDLPGDAETPRVRALDFEDEPVWTFSLSSASDTATLMRMAKILSEKIEDVSKVDRIQMRGFLTQEIQIVLSPEKIASFGLDPNVVFRTIQSALASYPAGSVKTDASEYSLTLDPLIQRTDDIRNLRLQTNNISYQLGEIALVWERAVPEQKYSSIANGNTPPKQAVSFFVFKTKSANIDATVNEVKETVNSEIAKYNGQFTISTLLDTGEEIEIQFEELLGEFQSTIFLVFLVLLTFLGIRQALIVSFTVPLTFFVTFGVMQVLGITLNFLSLFALLLSLGLLVDDAIVVVSATTSYYRTGRFTPYETALLVWRDFIVPIWTTTIATVWAFLPLLLSTGIIGEFIKTIPIVVSTSLLTSTAIAVLITLPLMMIILKPQIPRRVKILIQIIGFVILIGTLYTVFQTNPLVLLIIVWFIVVLVLTYRLRRVLVERTKREIHSQLFVRGGKLDVRSGIRKWDFFDFLISKYPTSHFKFSHHISHFPRLLRSFLAHGLLDMQKFAKGYERLIYRILGSGPVRRKIVVAVIIFSLFSYVLVPLGFVVNEFFPKEDTELLFVSVELPPGTSAETSNREAIALLDELRHTEGIGYVLSETGRSAPTGFTSGSDTNNIILFTLVIPEEEKEKYNSIDIAKKLRADYASYQKGKLSVVEISGGPPAGADIQIKLLGADLSILNAHADRIIAFLDIEPGITTSEKSIKPGVGKIVFAPDLAKLSQAGITVDTIGRAIRLFASGLTVDSLEIDNETLDIVIRENQKMQYAETLGSIQIPAQNGPTPLLSLGTLTLSANPTVITRENGKRTLSVSAGVESGYSISTINKKLEDFASTLPLDEGYEWKTGGINEENQKSVESILLAMILATILIFGTMVIQFTSYRKAVIVLLVIPLAISGVFVVFAATGTPLSFPALIGVLALYGVVVNNSMMIVDKINANLATGMHLRHAIADASSSRVEPILLTKMATIMGLLPITLSDPLWRGLGGAIISGLLFSSSIMLFFIPVVYYTWYKGEE